VYVVSQQLGKNVTTAKKTHATIEELSDAYFSMQSVLYEMKVCVCLCIPLSLLGNGLVKTFPRQRGIVGGIDFYAVHVVSKESSSSQKFFFVVSVIVFLLIGGCKIRTQIPIGCLQISKLPVTLRNPDISTTLYLCINVIAFRGLI
jgi:hypothetical protein